MISKVISVIWYLFGDILFDELVEKSEQAAKYTTTSIDDRIVEAVKSDRTVILKLLKARRNGEFDNKRGRRSRKAKTTKHTKAKTYR